MVLQKIYKKSKFIICLFMVVLPLLTFGVIYSKSIHSVINDYAYAESAVFDGGDGSADAPFLISQPLQLNALRHFVGEEHADKYFKLTQDIDLKSYLAQDGYNDGKGWQPIGDFGHAFYGSLDGDGFTLSELWLNRPDEDFVGLFYAIENADIKNLHVVLGENGIIGGSSVGGIAGSARTEDSVAKLHKCSVSGDIFVVGKDDYYASGGLFGHSYGYFISQCAFDGSISFFGDTDNAFVLYLGGLVGESVGSTMLNCYVNAKLNGNTSFTDNIGGIAGGYSQHNFLHNSFIKLESQGAFPYFGNPSAFFGNKDAFAINSYYIANDAVSNINATCKLDEYSRKLSIEESQRDLFLEIVKTSWDFTNIWGLIKMERWFPAFWARLTIYQQTLCPTLLMIQIYRRVHHKMIIYPKKVHIYFWAWRHLFFLLL